MASQSIQSFLETSFPLPNLARSPLLHLRYVRFFNIKIHNQFHVDTFWYSTWVKIKPYISKFNLKKKNLKTSGSLSPYSLMMNDLFIKKILFQAFKDNRVEFTVRVKHHEENPSGRIYFMNEPKVNEILLCSAGAGKTKKMCICVCSGYVMNYCGINLV